MTVNNSYQHFHIEKDRDHIMWITIDRKDSSVNMLNREIFIELDDLITKINEQNPTGVVFVSGKKKGFIAGADINQFVNLKSREEAFDLMRDAQVILNKIEALPMPTVALINGFCLGGGLEFALACLYRIALDNDSTKIGLPEIKLGIHPGWGGTVRLPRLIGAPEAMKIILAGAAYPAKKAKKIGMVDAVVPERELRRAASYYILKKPAPHTPKGIFAKISNADIVRPWLGKIFYKNLEAKKVNQSHYPAPYAVVDRWIKDGAKNDQAYINEANSVADLFENDTAKNLVRVFFLQQKMKNLAKGVKFQPKHVHVIGAGTMGGDIAAWCALRGMYVTLQDQTPEKVAPAIKRANQLFQKKLRESRLIQAAMDRLQPDVDGLGVVRADIIIEAVFEDLKVKQNIFKTVEKKAKPDAILATNTSSIPLEKISDVMQTPSRLVGIHFFNPVAKMMLVEVVKGKKTSNDVIDKATAFVTAISRLPLPVASSPGFLINRLLVPYLFEAMKLYEEGVSATDIDQAAVKFGMPMGPIQLADMIGLDVCLSIVDHFPGLSKPKLLQEMVDAGKLGVKSGKGFYEYQNGKKVKKEEQEKTKVMPDITDRMILRLVNEAVTCLHEKVITDADLLDAGMIFGTGFAPFRGGPIHYAESRGIESVMQALEKMSKMHGDRFKPLPGWEEFKKASSTETNHSGINSSTVSHQNSSHRNMTEETVYAKASMSSMDSNHKD